MSSETLPRLSPHAPTTSPTKKSKRKRDKDGKKEDKQKEKEHEKQELEAAKIVTCTFAGNEYEGLLTTDWAGCRYLEGVARYTWADGIKYEGPFVASHICGRGKFTWPDGSTYEGEIQDGKRHGEGIYIGADGVTKYDGQWRQGKRHGTGRLSYDAFGDSAYYGEWEDGWKHGNGRQVWPSGNVYEGQWQLGKMSGQGTMTWKDSGIFEQYCGHWEDNQPQGMGTHTWHAQESRPDPSGKEGPTQQMNNRYDGEWNKGLRHGQGEFYYANGAKFSGVWTENVKHGEGRYTFEDGKVYSGPFVNDQMKDYVQPDSLQRDALNIGAEDNPIRRCIDISDLEAFALPPDASGIGFTQGSGYDGTEEVLREVYNMLLRHLGELKQAYCHYRKILPRQGEDPFVLSMHQVWILARDFDLLTPTCSLSTLNRCILSGSRHHQEVTSEEESHDLRPLTPREHHHHRRESTNDRLESRASPSMCHDTSTSQLSEGKQQEHALNAQDDADDGSSEYTDDESNIPPSRGDEAECEQVATEQNAIEQNSAVPENRSPSNSPRHQSVARGSLWSSTPTIIPLYSRFWRNESASDLVNIHAPNKILMLRHFIELFVRVALVRYPNEGGLEHQVRRLFKETLAPRFGKPSLDIAISFLMDCDIQRVFKDVHCKLWDTFKTHAAGEGAYGPPQWVTQDTNAQDTEKAVGVAEDVSKDTRPASGALGLDTAEKASPAEASLPNHGVAHVRKRRHGLGGQQRRLHLKARMDVTIRVKDVLRLLDNAGFLVPLGEKDKYPPYSVDIHSSVFLDLNEPEDQSQRPNTQESIMGDLGGLKGLLSIDSPPLSPSPPIGQSAEQGFASEGERGSVQSPLLTPKVQDTAKENNPVVEVPTTDVLTCNFTLTFLEVLRIVLEVLSPASIDKLSWAVRGEDSPMDQRIAVLDFVESELTYCEFQRLLLRISERKTKDLLPTAGEFPLHRRLEGFLKHVFLPSLEKPYSLPKKEEEVKDEPPPVVNIEQVETVPSPQPPKSPVAAETSNSPERPNSSSKAASKAASKSASRSPSKKPTEKERLASKKAAETSKAPESPKDPPVTSETEVQPVPVVEEAVEEVRKFELWQGFEGSDLHEQEEMGALRAWPDDYESSVANWD